jgi:hypothetical protein
VTVMTISAHGRAGVAAGHGFSVHALSVRQEWPVADAAALHRRLIAVAPAARLSNVGAIDRRI